MKVNWCYLCGNGANFGDQLTPTLLDHFGIPYEWAPAPTARLVVVGSILSKLPDGWTGTVLGTGFIRKGMHRTLRARILAVRGVLSRNALGLPKSTVLGDAGLLVSDLTPVEPGDRTLVVPHYVDRDMRRRHPKAEFLDIRTPPLEFIRQIGSASLVYTSSLHALIAADALGIKHVYEPHARVVGGTWKFEDFGSALGERVVPFTVCLSSRESVERCQAGLREAFLTLARERVD